MAAGPQSWVQQLLRDGWPRWQVRELLAHHPLRVHIRDAEVRLDCERGRAVTHRRDPRSIPDHVCTPSELDLWRFAERVSALSPAVAAVPEDLGLAPVKQPGLFG